MASQGGERGLWMSWAVVLYAALCTGVVHGAPGDWILGRATYFDAPEYWKAAFPPSKFGDLFGNSCGYLNRQEGVPPSNAGFPLPFDGVGAVTDAMPDFIGSCGRCYEVRCKSGPILFNETTYASVYQGYHLPRHAPLDLPDPEGQIWPGVPDTVDPAIRWTQCRDKEASIVITIIDACPCTYIGGRQQEWCCGPIDHFDLSFWAFNKLAHPLYGMMMLEYRPVDCTTREPLDSRKPFISKKIYVDRPQAGWGWSTYSEKESVMIAEGAGIDGSAATCVSLAPGGGLSFWCRECHKEGFQPFNAVAVDFWIRSNEIDPTTLTSSRAIPNLELYLSQMHVLKYTTEGSSKEPTKFCNKKPTLGDYVPIGSSGDWMKFQIPLLDFKCHGGLTTSTSNRIVFSNPGLNNAIFCLDDIEIL